jgi:hypothetical protein
MLKRDVIMMMMREVLLDREGKLCGAGNLNHP